MIISAPIFWLFIGFAQCNEEGKHRFVRFHSKNIIFHFPVIIVTGGLSDGSTRLSSVEMLFPSGVPLPCTVPPLPTPRYSHTQDGEVACGDVGGRTSCLTLTGQGWQESHQLQEERYWHSSWRSPSGLLLMGGKESPNTTSNSSSTSSFTLAYDTR